MAYDFPASPAENQEFTPAGGVTYVYKAPRWTVKPTSSAAATAISDPPPASPTHGQLWWESDTGNTYIYYVDPGGAPGQWVQMTGPAGSGEQNHIASVPADMYAGFKTSGNRFIINDKADGTGTDVFSVSELGQVAHGGILMAPGQIATGFVKQKGTAAGQFYAWRITDDGTHLGANSKVLMTLNDAADTNLNLLGSSPALCFYPGAGSTRVGYIQSVNGGTFTINGEGANVNVLPPANGQLFVGPRTAVVAVNSRAVISYLGTTSQYGLNCVAEGAAGTSYPVIFTYPPSTIVGSISHSTTTTAFNTTSDARLKEFTGEFSGEDAAEIIRADPVRRFNWVLDGSPAVGWSAQDSYAVSQDLATPGDDLGADARTGDEGFQPWGMDQAKRTPYLWAALAMALDKIEALETRLAALEGGSSGV